MSPELPPPRTCREEGCDRPAVPGDERCVLHRGRLGPAPVTEAPAPVAEAGEAGEPVPAREVDVEVLPSALPARVEWTRGVADSMGWTVAFWGTVALVAVGAPLLGRLGDAAVAAGLAGGGLLAAYFVWRAPRSAWEAVTAARGWRRFLAAGALVLAVGPLATVLAGIAALLSLLF